MIGYLQGQVLEVNPESALVSVSGVGYEVLASLSTLAELQVLQQQKKTANLWIYTNVREDALQLFGFLSRAEKQFFLTLLKVNGVGPRMALHALSGASFERICEMIESEDVKGLSKLPKVGKKTAEQMVLTLKGKLVFGEGAEARVVAAAAVPHPELSSALLNLGFHNKDVSRVLETMPKDIGFDQGLREALASLTSL